jgi:hypothetical protein
MDSADNHQLFGLINKNMVSALAGCDESIANLCHTNYIHTAMYVTRWCAVRGTLGTTRIDGSARGCLRPIFGFNVVGLPIFTGASANRLRCVFAFVVTSALLVWSLQIRTEADTCVRILAKHTT